jgi:hypothetical protein
MLSQARTASEPVDGTRQIDYAIARGVWNKVDDAPEPTNKQDDPEPPEKKLGWRVLLLPIAFAWIFFLLSAPLVLIDERIAWIALAVGAAVGCAVIVLRPSGKRAAPRREARQLPRAPLTLSHKLLLTACSAALASAVGWFLLTNDLKGRIFGLLAVLIVIDMIRRPLRRAWGLAGSAAGLVVSGGLIVLLLKAVNAGEEDSSLPIIAGLLLLFEVREEYQSLKRMQRVQG